MSARLTLLLLCDQTEFHSPFISALIATGFQVLIEHNPEDAEKLLSHLAADAIMIRHPSIQEDSLVGVELKRVAPRTPIILFPQGTKCAGPRPGFDSICHADPQDEIVARAVAVFFHSALNKQAPQQPVCAPSRNVQVPGSNSKTQLTLSPL